MNERKDSKVKWTRLCLSVAAFDGALRLRRRRLSLGFGTFPQPISSASGPCFRCHTGLGTAPAQFVFFRRSFTCSSVDDGSFAGEDSRRRVKIYVLNETHVWDDKGTGHVTCSYIDKLNGLGLSVRSEQDSSILLESKILPHIAYQKQQETLIVWSDGDNGDLALSFQEREGCDEIWKRICQVQGRDPSLESLEESNYDGQSDEETGDSGTPTSEGSRCLQLPPCELSRLSEINEFVSSCLPSVAKRDALANAIESDGYIRKLLDLFRVCEDLENVESLQLLCRIVKNVFLLNKTALFEILFSEENIYSVVGILEYDPAYPAPVHHRDFLWEKATFKEVLPIRNAHLKSKIHQTFRVQYILDMILMAPPIFEDTISTTVSSFIFFNKVEIVSLIQDDGAFLKDLFSLIINKATSNDKRRDAALFLKELCGFSQLLQQENRDEFLKTLTYLGVLTAIETCFNSSDETTRLTVADIFAYIVDYNVTVVREYALNESMNNQSFLQKKQFFNLVIDQMFNDPDPELGAAMQLAITLKTLIDPETLLTTAQSKYGKNDFLSYFYKRCMDNLCSPMFLATTEDRLIKDCYRTANLLNLVLDMLTFCVERHSSYMRNFIIYRDLLKRVLLLLKSRHSFLVISTVRLFRRIVQLKDEVYNSYIISEQHFGPIVQCFRENGSKYNLLNSVLLELFEFIRVDDIKTLCAHVVEKYIDEFKDVNYVKTFKLLVLRYEQQKDRMSAANAASSGPKSTYSQMLSGQEKDRREADELEEQWFNNDEEENWDSDLPSGSIVDAKVSVDDSLPFAPSSDSVLGSKGGREICATSSCSSSSLSSDNGVVSSRPLSPANKSPTTAAARSYEPEFPSLIKNQEEDDGVFPKVFKGVVANKKIVIKPPSSSVLSAVTSPPSSSVISTTKALVDYDFDESDEEDDAAVNNESAVKVQIVDSVQKQSCEPLPSEMSLESPRKRLCLEENAT